MHLNILDYTLVLIFAIERSDVLCADSFRPEQVSLDDAVFLNVASYETHAGDGALTEAYRNYIDVMYMIEGSETVWVKPTDGLLHITASYDADGDALLAETAPDGVPSVLKKVLS